MINIAVCDDNQAILTDICGRIAKYRPDYSIEAFSSGRKLLESGRKYDIVFLDIEMPDKDGMETAKLLRTTYRDAYIVFLTSHTEYMREAFKVRAYRYLVKPVCENDLYESISQAEKDILSTDKVVSIVNAETTLIDLDGIVCIETCGNGALIYTEDGVHESNRSLKYWAEKLGTERFFKVHKSYLAAFAHMRSFDQSGIRMAHTRDPIPISRRNQSAFKKAFYVHGEP